MSRFARLRFAPQPYWGTFAVLAVLLLAVVGAAVTTRSALAAPARQQALPDLPPLPPLPPPPNAPECDPVAGTPLEVDCEALVHIYNEMNGPNWLNKTGWLVADTPCDWYGITCGVVDGALRVTGIELYNEHPEYGPGFPGNNLTGDIPPEIGNLDALKVLDLSYNQLTFWLPPQIAYLTNLEVLRLVNCRLYGAIPEHIGYMTAMRDLVIYGNRFSGIIPGHIGYLTDLHTLVLGYTNLTGNLPPQIGRLTQLAHLRIFESPDLTGEIPASYADLDLVGLDFQGNNLTGPFPAWVANMGALQSLRLAGNSFTGPYPTGLRTLNLIGLSLSPTDVELQIPLWLDELEALRSLYLGTSPTRGYTGEFPAYVLEMDSLIHFQLVGNNLEGEVPASAAIWQWPQLVELQIIDDTLSLNIPDTVTLPGLDTLWLEGDHFGGSAAALSQATALKAVYLLDGQFTGSLAGLADLPNLRTVWVANNRFSGPLPANWAAAATLQSLRVQGNALSGPVPDTFTETNMPNLSDLNLGYNLLLPSVNPAANERGEALNPGWQTTQTRPPTNVEVVESSATGTVLTWTPPLYTADLGHYEITVTPTQTDPNFPDECSQPFTVVTSALDGQAANRFQIANLCPNATYEFQVATVTLPHAFQKNRLESGRSNEAAAATAINSLQLYIISLDHAEMTQKFDSVLSALHATVARGPGHFSVVLIDRYGQGNTEIYLMAGRQPLKINGLPDPLTGQLDPALTEYDMSNSGVLVADEAQARAGNHLGAFIRWAIDTYAPESESKPDIPVTLSYIGHGVPLGPPAAKLHCLFNEAADGCSSHQARLGLLAGFPWAVLPTRQDINPDDWTDQTPLSIISPYALAQALDMGTNGGLRPLKILDVIHCFGATVEEFYELAYPRPPALPDPTLRYADVILGSPNYTYFGPELLLESLLAVDTTLDPGLTAAAMLDAYDIALSDADGFDALPDVDHPRFLIAVDARDGKLAAVKGAMDNLSYELYEQLDTDVDTFLKTKEALLAAHTAAAHYDTTLCTPQDWQLDHEDGLSDLFSLALALEDQFGDVPDVFNAAEGVAIATERAILHQATVRKSGAPWFAEDVWWGFEESNALGLAVYSDFVGKRYPGNDGITVGWQAYWYTSRPFGAGQDAPRANLFPLQFVQPSRPGERTWADVLQLFWQGPGGAAQVPSSACTVQLPQVQARRAFVPVASAP